MRSLFFLVLLALVGFASCSELSYSLDSDVSSFDLMAATGGVNYPLYVNVIECGGETGYTCAANNTNGETVAFAETDTNTTEWQVRREIVVNQGDSLEITASQYFPNGEFFLCFERMCVQESDVVFSVQRGESKMWEAETIGTYLYEFGEPGTNMGGVIKVQQKPAPGPGNAASTAQASIVAVAITALAALLML